MSNKFFANAIRKLGAPANQARQAILTYQAWQPFVPNLTLWDAKILASPLPAP